MSPKNNTRTSRFIQNKINLKSLKLRNTNNSNSMENLNRARNTQVHRSLNNATVDVSARMNSPNRNHVMFESTGNNNSNVNLLISDDYDDSHSKIRTGLLNFKSVSKKVDSILPKIRASSIKNKHSRSYIASSIEPLGMRRLGYKRKLVFRRSDENSSLISTKNSTMVSILQKRLKELKLNVV